MPPFSPRMTAFFSPKVAGSARLAGVSASEKVLKGFEKL
jgi:hypothetical protein